MTEETTPLPPMENERLTAEWAYQQGLQYMNRGMTADALRYFQLAIDRDPQHLRAYLSLGDLYTAQNNFLLAETYYNKILQQDPNSIPALSASGTMQWKKGNYNEALSLYRKVLELDPTNQFAKQQIDAVTSEFFDQHSQQAHAYRDAGDLVAAATELQKAYSLYPERVEVAVEIGELYLQQRDYMMADGYF
jgi:tetratricopeptide (TPR) repeat protein